MTPEQIKQTGYVIERYVPTGASAEVRRTPWVTRKRGAGASVLPRRATRAEAVEALHTELTDPDGVLRTGPVAAAVPA